MSYSRLQLRERWFYLLILPLAIAVEWAFAASQDWQAYPRSEWVILFDLCVFVPILYLAFFSHMLSFKARLIRSVGIAGLGLFAARGIVPEGNQFITADLAQLRNALIVLVIAFELVVVVKLVRTVFRSDTDAAQLERDFAVPGWIARLMLLEARFWKAVWRFLGRGKD